MKRSMRLKAVLAGGSCLSLLASAALASGFNIPGGDLATALDTYSKQTGVAVLVSGEALRGVKTKGAKGELSADAALASILSGTGFTTYRSPAGAIGITREEAATRKTPKAELADAAPAPAHAAASVETVVVTSSKIKGDIQTVPIAITALSQEQLTSRQIAGGPDLVKEVPNLTFSKTNFTGYNIEIRGIGTQAISVTTDPAVAVALNDIPFIRNHFFEQEFYDVGQVEVLRGPQGTLYGRNATAGVVNVISAKPTDQFEAMLSADWGNYYNRRYEGMVNIPIVDDRFDLRVAGEWTKRNGYTINENNGQNVDGRDLWSSRVTLG
ncbi:MAG TPA: TonB-dependent receptor, partial [Rhizomicrobium sp.]|nr:TonB-dependent receptor [Rhizomicrobium sp.]